MKKRFKLKGLKQLIIGFGIGLIVAGLLVEPFIFGDTPVALFLVSTGVLLTIGLPLTLPKDDFNEKDERL